MVGGGGKDWRFWRPGGGGGRATGDGCKGWAEPFFWRRDVVAETTCGVNYGLSDDYMVVIMCLIISFICLCTRESKRGKECDRQIGRDKEVRGKSLHISGLILILSAYTLASLFIYQSFPLCHALLPPSLLLIKTTSATSPSSPAYHSASYRNGSKSCSRNNPASHISCRDGPGVRGEGTLRRQKERKKEKKLLQKRQPELELSRWDVGVLDAELS